MLMKKKFKRLWHLTLGFTLSAILIFLAYIIIELAVLPAFVGNESREFFFKSGQNARTLATALNEEKIIRHPYFFVAMAYLQGKASFLKAGRYRFTPDMSAQAILNKIYKGQLASYKVTFTEGMTLKQILKTLHENHYIQSHSTISSIPQLANELKIPYSNPEGWFFPDTYEFFYGMTDIAILQLAYERMESILEREWFQCQLNILTCPYSTAYEGLIAASLIEKETAQWGEKKIIAGIILQRLKKKMKLQIDSTVIYALGDDYRGHLSKSDLKIDSSYNTYLHYGLPPAPIASPGSDSIEAAFHPEKNSLLYFVANGEGGHTFTSDLNAHKKAVRHYVLEQHHKLALQIKMKKNAR